MVKTKRKVKNVPFWVSYITPYTCIVPDGESPLKIELDEINNNTYNHGKLCEIVKTFTVKRYKEVDIHVCYDGALAISRTSTTEKREDAVKLFNEIFCCLLIGGLFIEAIDSRDVVTGSLHEIDFIWPVGFGHSASSHLHGMLRMRVASNIDSIKLLNPPHIYVSDFTKMFDTGLKVLQDIPNFSPEFLIRGITELYYRNWSTALSNLWITVEQIIDFIWNQKIINDLNFNIPTLANRKESMQKDNRTWASSVKQEILYQVGVLNKETYTMIYPARQARNKLIHEGMGVPEKVVHDLFKGIISLLINTVGLEENIIKRIELNIKSHNVYLEL